MKLGCQLQNPTVNDSPQPQASFTFGFLNANRALGSDKGKNAGGYVCGHTLRHPPSNPSHSRLLRTKPCYQSGLAHRLVLPPHRTCLACPRTPSGTTNQRTPCCAPQFGSAVDSGPGATFLVLQLQKTSKSRLQRV